MINEKMYMVMKNFSEDFLKELLGDLKDSLIEWSIDKDLVTKKNMIDIILSVNGLALLENSKFLYNFYLSMEDLKDLKRIAEAFGVLKEGEKFDQTEIAMKLSKIKFCDNEGYKLLISDY